MAQPPAKCRIRRSGHRSAAIAVINRAQSWRATVIDISGHPRVAHFIARVAGLTRDWARPRSARYQRSDRDADDRSPEIPKRAKPAPCRRKSSTLGVRRTRQRNRPHPRLVECTSRPCRRSEIWSIVHVTSSKASSGESGIYLCRPRYHSPRAKVEFTNAKIRPSERLAGARRREGGTRSSVTSAT